MKGIFDLIDKVKAYYASNKKTIISTGLILFTYGLYNEYKKHKLNSIYSSLEHENLEPLDLYKTKNINSLVYEVAYDLKFKLVNMRKIEGTCIIKFKLRCKSDMINSYDVYLMFKGKIIDDKFNINHNLVKLRLRDNLIEIPSKYLKEDDLNEIKINYSILIDEKGYFILNGENHNWIIKPDNSICYFAPCFYHNNNFNENCFLTITIDSDREVKYLTNCYIQPDSFSDYKNTINNNNNLKNCDERYCSELFYTGKLSNFIISCFLKDDYDFQQLKPREIEQIKSISLTHVDKDNINGNNENQKFINLDKSNSKSELPSKLNVFYIQDRYYNEIAENDLETIESNKSEISENEIEMLHFIFDFHVKRLKTTSNISIYILDSEFIMNKPFTMTRRFKLNESDEDNNLFYISKEGIIFIDKSIFTSKNSIISQLTMLKNINYLL